MLRPLPSLEVTDLMMNADMARGLALPQHSHYVSYDEEPVSFCIEVTNSVDIYAS